MFTFELFHIPRILTKKYCEEAALALEKILGFPLGGIVNIVAIHPEKMAEMNKSYRGKDGATDILTFSFLHYYKENNTGFDPSLKSGEMVVGEIYLCPEKIKIYAKEAGRTYPDQLKYIIIHGLAHLVGYDHELEKDAKVMEGVEKEIQVEIRTKNKERIFLKQKSKKHKTKRRTFKKRNKNKSKNKNGFFYQEPKTTNY